MIPFKGLKKNSSNHAYKTYLENESPLDTVGQHLPLILIPECDNLRMGGLDSYGSSSPAPVKEAQWGTELPISGFTDTDLNHSTIQLFILYFSQAVHTQGYTYAASPLNIIFTKVILDFISDQIFGYQW